MAECLTRHQFQLFRTGERTGGDRRERAKCGDLSEGLSQVWSLPGGTPGTPPHRASLTTMGGRAMPLCFSFRIIVPINEHALACARAHTHATNTHTHTHHTHTHATNTHLLNLVAVSSQMIDGCVFSPSLSSFIIFLWEGWEIGKENFPFGSEVNSRTGILMSPLPPPANPLAMGYLPGSHVVASDMHPDQG